MGKARKSVLGVFQEDSDEVAIPERIPQSHHHAKAASHGSLKRLASQVSRERWQNAMSLTKRDRLGVASEVMEDIDVRRSKDAMSRTDTLKSMSSMGIEGIVQYLTEQLEQKDDDLQMAAEIGKALVEEQRALQATNEALNDRAQRQAARIEELEGNLLRLRAHHQQDQANAVDAEVAELSQRVNELQDSLADAHRLRNDAYEQARRAVEADHRVVREGLADAQESARALEAQLLVVQAECTDLRAQVQRGRVVVGAVACVSWQMVELGLLVDDAPTPREKELSAQLGQMQDKLGAFQRERDTLQSEVVSLHEQLASASAKPVQISSPPPLSPPMAARSRIARMPSDEEDHAPKRSRALVGDQSIGRLTGLSIVAEIEERLQQEARERGAAGGGGVTNSLMAGEEFFMMTVSCLKLRDPEFSMVQIDTDELFQQVRRQVPFTEWEPRILDALKKEIKTHPPARLSLIRPSVKQYFK